MMFSALPVSAKKAKVASVTEPTPKEEYVLTDKEQFKFKYFYLEALRNREAGDLASASDNLYRCHLINPKSAVVFFELAVISSMQQMYNSAMSYAQRAVALNPSNVRYKRALAELVARNDNYNLAIEMYNELLQIDSEHSEAYYPQLASLYSITKQYDKACEALDEYAKLTELSSAIVEEKFKLYLKAGDKKKAFQQVDELINQYPEDYSYVSYKAELYYALSDSVSANKTFQNAFKRKPNDPNLQYVYAQYLNKLGRDEEALSYYKKIIDNPASTYDLRSGAIMTIAMDSSVVVPDSIFTKFVDDYPKEYIPYLCHGMQMYVKKDTLCYDKFKQSLAINPAQEEVWNLLIGYYESTSQPDSLIQACESALKSYPQNVRFRCSYGSGLHQLKRDSLAISQWEQAISLSLKQANPVTASAIAGLIGDCYQELGNTEKSYVAYDSALVYDKSNVLVLNNYAYYLSCENRDLERAERMSGRAVKSDPNNFVFLDTYAWICFKLGEYTMASLYIEQAYNHGGGEVSELLEHYGDIMYKTGEPKERYLSMWKKALELIEKNKEEYKGIEKLKLKVKTESYVE